MDYCQPEKKQSPTHMLPNRTIAVVGQHFKKSNKLACCHYKNYLRQSQALGLMKLVIGIHLAVHQATNQWVWKHSNFYINSRRRTRNTLRKYLKRVAGIRGNTLLDSLKHASELRKHQTAKTPKKYSQGLLEMRSGTFETQSRDLLNTTTPANTRRRNCGTRCWDL